MFTFFQIAIFLTISDKIFSLPNDIDKCRMDDEECLISSSNKVISKYIGGISEIDFPSHNPFVFDEFPIKHDFGAIKANGVLKNLTIFGFSEITFQKFSGFEKNLLEVHFGTPKFSASTFYKATAVVLGFEINDEGPLAITFYDFSIKLTFKLERYTKNEKEHFRVVGTEISSDLETGEFEAPEVSSVIVWTFNKSFNILMKSSMKTYIGDEWGTKYEKTFNKVFSKVPIKDLFLM